MNLTPQPSEILTAVTPLDSVRAKQLNAKRKMRALLDRHPCRRRTDELRHVVEHHHD